MKIVQLDLIEYLDEIKRNTRYCPYCRVSLIQKIEDNQYQCESCSTVFGWNQLRESPVDNFFSIKL